MTDSKIYIGNLPYSISEDELRDHFQQYGQIDDIKIIIDFNTGRSKGFGFITYTTSDHCQNALAENGKEFNGRKLKVNVAKEGGTRRGGNQGSRAHHIADRF